MKFRKFKNKLLQIYYKPSKTNYYFSTPLDSLKEINHYLEKSLKANNFKNYEKD